MTKMQATGQPTPALGRWARFVRDESGAMLVFYLVILTLMLMLGGMAVDLMRFEAMRTRVQSTADAAALAAASMRQMRPPQEVVSDWFDKAGLSDNLGNVIVDDQLNYRNVRVETSVVTETYFMRMMGINELNTDPVGEAEERRSNVEVAMVLDVSGSMDGSRLRALKTAAKEFVTTLLEEDTEERVSIALVPYNGQVAIGPDLMARYTVSDRHTNSYCVDLPPSVYDDVAMGPDVALKQHVFADTYNSGKKGVSSDNRWCQTDTANYLRPPNSNAALLSSQIDGFKAIGATSIDAGLRWGAAMIDPETRPIFQQLVQQNKIPKAFEVRPFDYDEPESLKVIVLMTDGEQWPNEYIADGYRGGNSPIYLHTDGNYSIEHSGQSGNKYWIPHKGEWHSTRWVGQPCNSCAMTKASGAGTPLTWEQVYKELSVDWIAANLYARAFKETTSSWVAKIRQRDGVVNSNGSHNVTAMNARLDKLCSALKAQNVVIFGIALETSARGADVIRSCASPNRFRDIATAEMSEVFREIRSQISALRLTQ